MGPPALSICLVWLFNLSTVEPIFKDISNSDNSWYKDRFANPCVFLYLSHTIYFYNKEYKKSLSCYNGNLVRKFRGKMERNRIDFAWENDLKHFASQSTPHKHSLMVADTFFGLASLISVKQSLWSRLASCEGQLIARLDLCPAPEGQRGDGSDGSM